MQCPIMGQERYVLLWSDRIGRRGGGILYIKESVQVYEIKLEWEGDFDEGI